MALASPVLIPKIMVKNRAFIRNKDLAKAENQRRMESARKLDLPVHESLDLSVLVDGKALKGFGAAPGISYYLKTDQGGLLFDLGYGDEEGVISHNLKHMNIDISRARAMVISHLHPDHMGGFNAYKANSISMIKGCETLANRPCFVPDDTVSNAFDIRRIDSPGLLPAGIGTTGPLSRSLFLMGPTKEQALLVNLKGKGIVVITGCGHPTIAKILAYTRALTDRPIYAVIGGLHLPVTDSPLRKPGLKVQMIWGTGKPPWQKITDKDVDQAIEALNQAGAKYLYLSSHDICDHSIKRLKKEINGETCCLEAGQTYTL